MDDSDPRQSKVTDVGPFMVQWISSAARAGEARRKPARRNSVRERCIDDLTSLWLGHARGAHGDPGGFRVVRRGAGGLTDGPSRFGMGSRVHETGPTREV